MYRLEKKFKFEAAHRLVHHDGKCARLHGHSWVGTIVCEGPHLQSYGPKRGMLLDYSDMGKALDPIIEEYLDHHDLNETLETNSPTSEYIAAWLYRKLSPTLPMLIEVSIEETCTCRCTYSPQEVLRRYRNES